MVVRVKTPALGAVSEEELGVELGPGEGAGLGAGTGVELAQLIAIKLNTNTTINPEMTNHFFIVRIPFPVFQLLEKYCTGIIVSDFYCNNNSWIAKFNINKVIL